MDSGSQKELRLRNVDELLVLKRCEAMERREPMMEGESWMETSDGTRLWILAKGYPRFDKDGGFRGYQGICAEITERKMAEEELTQSAKQAEVAR